MPKRQAFSQNFIKQLRNNVPDFLPVSITELNGLGFSCTDFVLITGDAYVDHPSFGAALIGKLLWAAGYSVGIITQPDVSKDEAFRIFGEPTLGFLVTSGNVDSMVNNYTAAKKPRSNDYYSPGGKFGKRPDRALTVYSRRVREIFGEEASIILGGIEASLRRLAHYDYWANAVRKPVIIDAQADLLIYGMAERALLEIAGLLAKGMHARDIKSVCGTVYKTAGGSKLTGATKLPSYEVVAKDRKAYAESFRVQVEIDNPRPYGAPPSAEGGVMARNDGANCLISNPRPCGAPPSAEGGVLVEQCGKNWVVQNPPQVQLSTEEMDAVYGIHFARAAHPSYKQEIPAIQEVKFSITATRGCFGACSFCSLAFHQGRNVTWRSHESIVREAEILTKLPDFKGYIHDIGGPTANFYGVTCKAGGKCSGNSSRKTCLHPEICKNLSTSHAAFLDVLRAVRKLPGVKKAFVRSGIRFDFMLADSSPVFLNELCEHHISGQLKIAPEHVCDNVLKHMGKPGNALYEKFLDKYSNINKRLGKKQFVVPYLMSGHPGSGLKEAIRLAEYLHAKRISPEQVQDFYPTPSTISACMFHAEVNPITGEHVYIAKTPKEKAMQRALIQYKLPQNYDLVYDALRQAGRMDLIGFGKKCLIRPKEYIRPRVTKKV